MPVKWYPSFASVLGEGRYTGTAGDHQLPIENDSKQQAQHPASQRQDSDRRSWVFINTRSSFWKSLLGSKNNDIELSTTDPVATETATSGQAASADTPVLQETEHQERTDNTDGTSSSPTPSVRRAGNTRHSGFPDPTTGPSRAPSHIVPSMRIPPHKLDYLRKGCHDLVAELDHHEMWGVDLLPEDTTHEPTNLVLAKFLQANAGDHIPALRHLRHSLTWRKEHKPREIMKRVFDSNMFAALGYIHDHQGVDGRVIVVFNLYGSGHHNMLVTSKGADEYIAWRIAMMEMALDRLRMGSLRELSNWHVADSYRIINVVDLTGLARAYWRYWGFRQRTVVKMFLNNYPDLVSQTFVTAEPGLQFDFSEKLWPLLPRATRQRVTFVDPRQDLAAQLPQVVGKWPKEFSTDHTAPPVCSGVGPKLDMGKGKGKSTEVDIKPHEVRVPVTSDQPRIINENQSVRRRRSNGTTHAVFEVDGVCGSVVM